MEKIKKIPKYQDVDGFRIPRFFSPEAFRSALRYNPRPDDVFIVTYPKCGTTWMQQIVWLIYYKGEPFRDAFHFHQSSPFLELTGADAVDIMERPGSIKLHLPFEMTPYSPEAKYIYVARNPKDCCVSFFHHQRLLPMYDFADGDFDVYFDYFIEGKTDFGDYFDNLLSWYPHRNDPNVLFLTFEDLKKDSKNEILKVAKFLGNNYEETLLKDNSLLERVIHRSSFKYMKENNVGYDNFLPVLIEGMKQGKLMSSGCKKFAENVGSLKVDNEPKGSFLRKGEVGDWKNMFTEEHVKRLDERTAEKTKGSDVMDLWKDL